VCCLGVLSRAEPGDEGGAAAGRGTLWPSSLNKHNVSWPDVSVKHWARLLGVQEEESRRHLPHDAHAHKPKQGLACQSAAPGIEAGLGAQEVLQRERGHLPDTRHADSGQQPSRDWTWGWRRGARASVWAQEGGPGGHLGVQYFHGHGRAAEDGLHLSPRGILPTSPPSAAWRSPALNTWHRNLPPLPAQVLPLPGPLPASLLQETC